MKKIITKAFMLFSVTTLIGLFFLSAGKHNPVFALHDINVYQEGLSSNWKNWSWNTSVNLKNTSKFYSSPNSLSFKLNSAWAALYLHTDQAVDLSQYETLQFQLRATQEGQKLNVLFYDENNKTVSVKLNLSDYGGNLSSSSWKEYNLPLSKVKSVTGKIKGVALQDATGNSQSEIFIDNIFIKPYNETSSDDDGSSSTPIQDPVTSEPDSPTTETPSTDEGTVPDNTSTPTTGGYSVSDGKVYKNGSSIKLKGVSWFGFDGDTKVAHGLWARNYKDMITQMKSVGFNSVRIPFCPPVLDSVSVSSVNYSLNPELKDKNSLQALDVIMNELNNQGMHILLDHHNPDCKLISDLWYTSSYSESEWIADVKFIAARYKNLPYFMGIDIKNEPKGTATWGTGNTKTDWKIAAEKAGKEVLAANSNILIFVQGVQNNPTCSSTISHFWGGNLEPVNCSTVNTNFIPSNKLVFSPHVYGPDVFLQSYFTESNFPENMPAIWEKHFGFLTSKGYTVVPGEWGGKYGNGGLSSDVKWQDKFVSYMKSKKMCNSYYWSWNPNSVDTGGILKDDWKTVWQNKLDMIKGYFDSCSY
jgi:aryl-phospho-beta-D-glucosidase BglC (GH1 family)